MTSGYGAEAGTDGDDLEILAGLQAGTEQYIRALAEMGVIIRTGIGGIEIDPATQELKIGHLVTESNSPGDVIIYHREDVTLWQMGVLIMLAEHARMNGPDPSHGWGPVRGLGWSCAVRQPSV